jgi:hypothetical protein
MKTRTPIKPVEVRARHYWPHLSALFACFLLAGTLEYHDAVAQAEHAEEVARKLDAEFAECLRGEWREVTEQGVHLGCLPVQRWDPKNRTTGVKK